MASLLILSKGAFDEFFPKMVNKVFPKTFFPKPKKTWKVRLG